MVKWLLYIIGILLIIMGILGFMNYPIVFNPPEPAWHAILKIIVGIIAVYGGTKVNE